LAHFANMTKDQGYPKPTKEAILAAAGKTVPDIIGPELRVLFCGINPGLYSGAIGHHFARPGNRFWPALYAAGFTERLLSPFEEDELLTWGYGITNLVGRATATADELAAEELIQGRRQLEGKIEQYRPRVVAVLGVGAYRTAFKQPKAVLGRQDDIIGGAAVWLLPNPSGLNAHYQLKDLAQLFRALRIAVSKDE
jgi:TDG/mug DNA glycosylase family protein